MTSGISRRVPLDELDEVALEIGDVRHPDAAFGRLLRHHHLAGPQCQEPRVGHVKIGNVEGDVRVALGQRSHRRVGRS